jgi:hypothetical protein
LGPEPGINEFRVGRQVTRVVDYWEAVLRDRAFLDRQEVKASIIAGVGVGWTGQAAGSLVGIFTRQEGYN